MGRWARARRDVRATRSIKRVEGDACGHICAAATITKSSSPPSSRLSNHDHRRQRPSCVAEVKMHTTPVSYQPAAHPGLFGWPWLAAPACPHRDVEATDAGYHRSYHSTRTGHNLLPAACRLGQGRKGGGGSDPSAAAKPNQASGFKAALLL